MQKTKVCVAATFKYFASYVYDLKIKLTVYFSQDCCAEMLVQMDSAFLAIYLRCFTPDPFSLFLDFRNCMTKVLASSGFTTQAPSAACLKTSPCSAKTHPNWTSSTVWRSTTVPQSFSTYS